MHLQMIVAYIEMSMEKSPNVLHVLYRDGRYLRTQHKRKKKCLLNSYGTFQ